MNPHKQQRKYAPIRARQRKQADRVGSSQHVIEASQNERRNRNLPGLPKYRTNHPHSSLADVMFLPVHCSVSPPVLIIRISSMHAASGLFSWTEWRSWHLQASPQFAPKAVDLSVRFIHEHFVQFSLESERSGLRKPPAERSTLCY